MIEGFTQEKIASVYPVTIMSRILVFYYFRNLCIKSFEYSGTRYFFDVQTSSEVREMFDKVHGRANSISVNDFSTLYTLFDHDHLLANMTWLLGKLSKNSGKNFVRD